MQSICIIKNCDGNLIFEFQVNNTILNYAAEILDYDWGVILCYTCKNNCDIKNFCEGNFIKQNLHLFNLIKMKN